jgi:hypothetical protein
LSCREANWLIAGSEANSRLGEKPFAATSRNADYAGAVDVVCQGSRHDYDQPLREGRRSLRRGQALSRNLRSRRCWRLASPEIKFTLCWRSGPDSGRETSYDGSHIRLRQSKTGRRIVMPEGLLLAEAAVLKLEQRTKL